MSLDDIVSDRDPFMTVLGLDDLKSQNAMFPSITSLSCGDGLNCDLYV